MLSAFGLFWTGEGIIGVPWPGQDLALLLFIGLFLSVGLAAISMARWKSTVAV